MIKPMNKKGVIHPLVLAIGFIASLLTILSISGIIDISPMTAFLTGDYTQVYKQNWGVIECVKNDAYDYSYIKWLDQQTEFKCNIYTDECEINVIDTETGINLVKPTGAYKVCKIDGTGCTSKFSYNLQTPLSFKILAGEKAVFNSGVLGASEENDQKITIKAKTFYIRGQENGKVYVQESCVLSSALKSRVEADGLNELSFTGANKFQNYMIDFVQVTTKTYTYNNKEVICQARELYGVDNVAFKDGVTHKIQGERITAVECCPTENNCATNFKFVVDKVRQCTYSSECSNGGNLFGITQVKAGKYSCINGDCILSEVSVECTSTAVCVQKYGESYVCDFTPSNWGKCKQSTTPNYCGDGYCDIGETKENCPDDCELECMEGEKLVSIERKEGCLIPIINAIGCETIIEKKCVKDTINWAMWFAIGFLAVALLMFAPRLMAGMRMLLSKIGIRI